MSGPRAVSDQLVALEIASGRYAWLIEASAGHPERRAALAYLLGMATHGLVTDRAAGYYQHVREILDAIEQLEKQWRRELVP